MFLKLINKPCLTSGEKITKPLVGQNVDPPCGIKNKSYRLLYRLTLGNGRGLFAYCPQQDSDLKFEVMLLGKAHRATTFEEQSFFGDYTRHAFNSLDSLHSVLDNSNVKLDTLFSYGVELRIFKVPTKYCLDCEGDLQTVFDLRKAKLLHRVYDVDKLQEITLMKG